MMWTTIAATSRLLRESNERREVRVPPTDGIEQPPDQRAPHTVVVDDDTRIRRSRRPVGIVVEVIGGSMDGARSGVGSNTLRIGRAEENDLTLSGDPSISARHACIVIDQGQYWLEDLGSTNGTYLGEGKVQGRVMIGPGTVFVVGRTTLELCSA
jgi:FHA domain